MGVSNIDIDAIIKKAETYMSTPKMQKRVWKKTDNNMINGVPVALSSSRFQQRPAVESSQVFSSTFNSAVEDAASSGILGRTAVTAVTNLSTENPTRSGNRYNVHMWIDGEGHRESLQPDEYAGIDNIAVLLNDGYEARNKVFGVWRGHNGDQPIWSRRIRHGAYFIENAVDRFKASKASQFRVIDIIISKDS